MSLRCRPFPPLWSLALTASLAAFGCGAPPPAPDVVPRAAASEDAGSLGGGDPSESDRSDSGPSPADAGGAPSTDAGASAADDAGAPASEAGAALLELEVFAPFATRVSVAGTFNDWSPDAALLARDDEGVWRGAVPEARAGDRYKLVVDGPEGRLWRNDPRALAVTSSVGESVVTALPSIQSAPFEPVPWNEAVVYELHVGTFVDEEGGAPGTFETALARLDDLAALGVTHLELLPIAEFAGDYSWGYNPAHPFAVESAYGGPEALSRFVEAAHERGMAVILDVVYNHLGPSDLDLWRFDGWYENDLGGAYFYNDWRAETPWGHTRPDYGRGPVRAYLKDNALFWLTRFDLDGLRFDSTGNIRAALYGSGDIPEGWSLLQWINDEANALPAWKVMIAEDLAGLGAITSPTSAGGAGFDAQWDATFAHPVRAALIASEDSARSMASVRAAITERADADAFARVIYTESHDEVANGRARVPEEIWPGNASSWFSRRRASLGIALVLTTPGVPMLFQGQELLEDGWFSDTDPVDWSKRETNADVWRATRDLIALRRNQGGATRGLTGPHVNVHHVNEADKVIAFHRWAFGGAGDDVVVVAHFANQSYASYEVGFPSCGAWRARTLVADEEIVAAKQGVVVEAEAAPRDGMPCSAPLELPPYGVWVFSQDG